MVWNWLTALRSRRKPPRWNVVMYSRDGCHLCEEAWEQLETAQQRYAFALRQENVDANPQWREEYGECVPVVVINGKVRFRGRINPVLLKRLIEGGERV
jgi:hypothetical protein